MYLSSYKLGNQKEVLKSMALSNKSLAYVPNARDFWPGSDTQDNIQEDIRALTEIGFEVEILDLKNYFNNHAELELKMKKYQGVFVRGGSGFVLRQAMKLSGFDNIIQQINDSQIDFLYSGYSAGICVLGPTLKGIELVDDIDSGDYKEKTGIIWEGLKILDYAFAPHYKSDHPESESINRLVEYYIANKILFKALRDGEVIIV